MGREEVDQINIVARWISHHSEDSERSFFSLPPALDQPDEIAAFATRVAAIVCAPAPDVAEDKKRGATTATTSPSASQRPMPTGRLGGG